MNAPDTAGSIIVQDDEKLLVSLNQCVGSEVFGYGEHCLSDSSIPFDTTNGYLYVQVSGVTSEEAALIELYNLRD
jgi:hypothetical protein